MKLPEGVRPYRTQKDLPLSKVDTWEIDTYGCVDQSGKPLPRRRWKVKGTPKRAAAVRKSRIAQLLTHGVRAKRTLTSEVPEDAGSLCPSMTLREYVEEHYWAVWGDTVRNTTLGDRQGHMTRYILPALGDLMLAEVNTPEAIRTLKATIKKNRRVRRVNYANQILASLSAVLGTASDVHSHDRPPLPHRVRMAYFKAGEFGAGEVVTEHRINGMRAGHLRHLRYTDDELRALFQAVKASDDPDFQHTLVGLGLFLGCRNGEACGLRWEDVDLQTGEASIVSIVDPKTMQWVQRTKSLAGTVTIEPTLLEALSRLRKRAKSKWILGPNEKGVAWLNSKNVGDRYKLLTRAAGMESYRYHRLRHTYCSRLADAGFRAEEIQVLARHKSIKSTYGYLSPNPERMREAARALTFRV